MEDDSLHFMLMEHIEGVTVEEKWLKDGASVEEMEKLDSYMSVRSAFMSYNLLAILTYQINKKGVTPTDRVLSYLHRKITDG